MQFLTIEDITKLVGVSESTVRRYVRTLQRENKGNDLIRVESAGTTRKLLIADTLVQPFIEEHKKGSIEKPHSDNETSESQMKGGGGMDRVVDALLDQLKEKDKQIERKDGTINELTKLNFVFQEQLRMIGAPVGGDIHGQSEETTEQVSEDNQGDKFTTSKDTVQAPRSPRKVGKWSAWWVRHSGSAIRIFNVVLFALVLLALSLAVYVSTR